jgi:hypothetical protein
MLVLDLGIWYIPVSIHSLKNPSEVRVKSKYISSSIIKRIYHLGMATEGSKKENYQPIRIWNLPMGIIRVKD